MKYQNYTLSDFLQDEFFIKSVLDTDEYAKTYWDGWLRNHPEKAHIVAQAREILLNINFPDSNLVATESDFDEVFQNILNQGKAENNKAKEYNKRVKLPYGLKIAAMLTTLLLCTYVYWNFYGQQEEIPVTKQEIWITKENPCGQRSTFQLPDGTIVKLNAGSRLTFNNDFQDTLRMARLVGEAYFEVHHNPEKPFMVQAGNISIKVLGTTFNVRSHKEDAVKKVTLLEGKVNLQVLNGTKINQLDLLPGEVVEYSPENNLMVKTHPSNNHDIAWTAGTIKFEAADFSAVATVLERWYGKKIVIKKLPTRTTGLNGEFENKSLYKVLETLSHTSGFNYEIKDKQVIIY